MGAIRASRPQEMKSSTSQRAGSSRTFLKTMYFTSGAKVITSRLRTRTSPEALYSRHSARASSEEILLRVLLDGDFISGRLLRDETGLTDKACIGCRPDLLNHPFGVIAP